MEQKKSRQRPNAGNGTLDQFAWPAARPLLEEWGVSLTDDMVVRLEQYVDLLLAWRRAMNLTAADSREGVLLDHVLDALSAVPSVRGLPTLVDVGSGAGLPGIPLAVAVPGLRVTLVEPLAKRAAFLRRATHDLRLNCTVFEGRREDFPAEPRFDAAISRAVVAPEAWLEQAQSLVVPSGIVLAMAGSGDLPAQCGALVQRDRIAYVLPRGGRHQLGVYVSRGTGLGGETG